MNRYDRTGIMTIIGKQNLFSPEIDIDNLKTVVETNLEDARGITDLLHNIAIDAYLLGRMSGIRGERARRARSTT